MAHASSRGSSLVLSCAHAALIFCLLEAAPASASIWEEPPPTATPARGGEGTRPEPVSPRCGAPSSLTPADRLPTPDALLSALFQAQDQSCAAIGEFPSHRR